MSRNFILLHEQYDEALAEIDRLRKELKDATEAYEQQCISARRAGDWWRKEVAEKDRQLANLERAWPHATGCATTYCRFCFASIGHEHTADCCLVVKVVRDQDCGDCDCNRKQNLERAKDGKAKGDQDSSD